MSVLLPATTLSTISTPSISTRIPIPLDKKQPSSFTRHKLGLNSAVKTRTFTRPTHRCRCCLAMPVEPTTTSSSQDGCMHSRACWVSKSVIAWNVDMLDGSCYLHASKAAALSFSNSGIQGHDVEIKLEGDDDRLPINVIDKFPHLQDYNTFKLPLALDDKILLKCQLAIAVFSSDGKCINATGLQLPGVLDELFSYDGPLGAVFSNDAVSVHLWGPTAQDVHALIYSDPCGVEPIDIVKLEEANGVWTSIGPRSWEGCYYVYEVSVYHPSTLQIEKCIANDPYARGLSADGKRTLLVNLEADGLKPEGWDNLATVLFWSIRWFCIKLNCRYVYAMSTPPLSTSSLEANQVRDLSSALGCLRQRALFPVS